MTIFLVPCRGLNFDMASIDAARKLGHGGLANDTELLCGMLTFWQAWYECQHNKSCYSEEDTAGLKIVLRTC